jgi:DNA-binding NarL/FixJ family response regulator
VTTRGGGAIEVLVAEQHRLVRAGLRVLLEADGDVIVVGEAARGEHAVMGARTLLPDVVLIDIHVPGCDGLQVTRRIVAEAELAQVGVLLLTPSRDGAEALAAVHAGADGVLLLDSEPRDLLRAVRAIAAGGAFLAPPFTRRLVAEVASPGPRERPTPAQLVELTDREREVMVLVAYGLSNAEIAARLHLSPATVKTHVARTLMKLRVDDRAQLTGLAYESGLILPRRAS